MRSKAAKRQQISRSLRPMSMAAFDELMDHVRKALATRYLDTDEVKLHDLAILLGFSSHAVLSAFFMEWTGRTPSEARMLS